MAHSPPDFTAFPPQQKAAYLGAIASLTTADRKASVAEVEFLSQLAEATGLREEDAQPVIDSALDPGSGSLRRSLDALKGSDLRFSLVQDLISFAQSDGQYSSEEQERIGQIGDYLGVSKQQYDALRQYQQAAAEGQQVDDPQFLKQSGLESRFNQLGLPKGGGMLSGILATVVPMILQQVLSSRGTGRPGTPTGAGGGGLMDVLGQVMGGGGGHAQPQGSSSGGGLMDVLGQVMGGAGGQPRPQGSSAGGGLTGLLGQVMGGAGGASPPSSTQASGMGGLGELLRVLGQGGTDEPAHPQSAATAEGRGGYAAAGKLLGGLFK